MHQRTNVRTKTIRSWFSIVRFAAESISCTCGAFHDESILKRETCFQDRKIIETNLRAGRRNDETDRRGAFGFSHQCKLQSNNNIHPDTHNN